MVEKQSKFIVYKSITSDLEKKRNIPNNKRFKNLHAETRVHIFYY